MRTKLDGLRKRLDALGAPAGRRRIATAPPSQKPAPKARELGRLRRRRRQGVGKSASKSASKIQGAAPPGQGVERDEGVEEAASRRRRRVGKGHGRLDDVLWRLRAARRRQGEQQARFIACVRDIRRIGERRRGNAARREPRRGTVLSVDPPRAFAWPCRRSGSGRRRRSPFLRRSPLSRRLPRTPGALPVPGTVAARAARRRALAG